MSSDGQGAIKFVRDRSIALFQSMKLSDCSFRVGPPHSQKVFEAHKLILSMASPVFETMFYGLLAEKEYPIDVPDVEPELFAILMEYIYTDRINIGTFKEATAMCYVAQKYMLSPVVEHCILCVKAKLCTNNVCLGYEFANFFEKSNLKEMCIKMMKTNAEIILSDPGLIDIHISTLVDIFNMDNLAIDSELSLFNALERYANANGSRPGDNDDCGKYRMLVKNIRFLSMTPKQFADGPGCSKLLQQHEKLAILLNISSDSVKECPMPEGFTTCKNSRKPPKIANDAAIPQLMLNNAFAISSECPSWQRRYAKHNPQKIRIFLNN